MALPPIIPDPPTQTAPASANSLGGCITFLASLLVVGVVAELLYKASPTASYAFILLVIMGYAVTGTNLDHLIAFLDNVQKGQTK